jgi:hypothetical protein
MSSPIIKRYKNSDGTIDIWIKDATSLRYSTVLIGMSSSITDEAIATELKRKRRNKVESTVTVQAVPEQSKKERSTPVKRKKVNETINEFFD